MSSRCPGPNDPPGSFPPKHSVGPYIARWAERHDLEIISRSSELLFIVPEPKCSRRTAGLVHNFGPDLRAINILRQVRRAAEGRRADLAEVVLDIPLAISSVQRQIELLRRAFAIRSMYSIRRLLRTWGLSEREGRGDSRKIQLPSKPTIALWFETEMNTFSPGGLIVS